MGVSTHRTANIEFVNAVLSDNSHAVSVDFSSNIRWTNSRIIGYSPSYQALVNQKLAQAPCARALNRNYGFRFTRDNPFGGSRGWRLTNTSVEGFDTLPCRTVAAMKLYDKKTGYGTMDLTPLMLDVSIDTNLIDLCPGVEAGYTDVYMVDIASSGSVNTILVDDSPEMTTFVDTAKCTRNAGRCHVICRDTCLRSVFYNVPAEYHGLWKLRVCDRQNWSLCVDVEEHSKHYRLPGRFAVHVPSGRQYDSVFVDQQTGAEVYPNDVVDVEVADTKCPMVSEDDFRLLDISRLETHPPTLSPTTLEFRCENTVRNSDMEDSGTLHWRVVGLGDKGETEGYQSPTALNYLGANRGRPWVARIETQLDIGTCFRAGTEWEFRSQLQLTDSFTGEPVSCTVGGILSCPRIMLTLRDQNSNIFHRWITGFPDSYSTVPGYNEFRGYWTVGNGEPTWFGRALVVKVGFLDFPQGIDLAIDDFEVIQVL